MRRTSKKMLGLVAIFAFAMAGRASAATDACSPSTYTVGPFAAHETLSGIAEKVYGHASWWPKIAKANGIDDPRTLRASTPGRAVILTVPCGDREAVVVDAKKKNPAPARDVHVAAKRTPARTPAARYAYYSTFKDNNPLNITLGARTKKWVLAGAAVMKRTKSGAAYLAFRHKPTGMIAAIDLFTSEVYAGLTLEQALRKWSGRSYGAEIVRGGGMKPTMRVSQLTTRDLIVVVKAMVRREGDASLFDPSFEKELFPFGPDKVRETIAWEAAQKPLAGFSGN